MKKKIYFLFKIVLLLFLFSNYSFGSTSIYYIDIDYLLTNSTKGKFIFSELTNLKNKNSLELKKIEDNIKLNEIEIKNQQNVISESEFKKKVNKLRVDIDEYKLFKNELLTNYEKIRNDSLSEFLTLITPIIQDFMKQNSIGILLDKKNIFIGDNYYDITNNVMLLVNDKIK